MSPSKEQELGEHGPMNVSDVLKNMGVAYDTYKKLSHGSSLPGKRTIGALIHTMLEEALMNIPQTTNFSSLPADIQSTITTELLTYVSSDRSTERDPVPQLFDAGPADDTTNNLIILAHWVDERMKTPSSQVSFGDYRESFMKNPGGKTTP